MTTNECSTNREGHSNPSTSQRTITISLGAQDRSGKETDYKRQTVKVTDLPRLMKEHNYSPIIWSGDYRLSENFEFATGFCVDVDKDGNIDASLALLKEQGWNYVLITTRSHKSEAHRFRILLPFNRRVISLKDYERIGREIIGRWFPGSDESVLDGARQLYFSPPDAIQRSRWDGKDYDVDSTLSKSSDSEHPTSVSNAWTDRLMVRTDKGQLVQVSTLKEKTRIHCPFHDDESQSAFLAPHKDRPEEWFIYCSACRKNYWKQKRDIPVEERCARFYSHGTDVCEAGIVGRRFVFSRVGQQKFYIWTEAYEKEAKDSVFGYLVRQKHVPTSFRVDNVGDIAATKSYYNYDKAEGAFVVHHAPLDVCLRDNEFIDNWLKGLFAGHTDFIKQWMAVYTYTNYQKLPTLIFKGERGSGKNTLAEALMTIYPSISQGWHGEQRDFTPEVQCKLLVADESVSSNEKQYRLLKQRSGQKFLIANQKYEPEYQVRNNVNIIVMSNDHTPVFVRREELPTNEKNNQFFVYEFPPRKGEIDPEIDKKIEKRLGHYIRTELKRVFEETKRIQGCRYSIPTPITDAEKALFDVNVTGLEAEADRFLQRMIETDDPVMMKCFRKGYFPSKFIDLYSISRGYGKNGIIRNLKERGYLLPKEMIRPQVDGKKWYSYELTQKALDWMREQQKPAEQSAMGREMDTQSPEISRE